mmetsp:Transcript_72898/g.200058  ORF Transcript_72898/g.200058 Transcript_72898/m.200058 type:complete len:345 (-) Transcript_72898:1743-2777(-)
MHGCWCSHCWASPSRRCSRSRGRCSLRCSVAPQLPSLRVAQSFVARRMLSLRSPPPPPPSRSSATGATHPWRPRCPSHPLQRSHGSPQPCLQPWSVFTLRGRHWGGSLCRLRGCSSHSSRASSSALVRRYALRPLLRQHALLCRHFRHLNLVVCGRWPSTNPLQHPRRMSSPSPTLASAASAGARAPWPPSRPSALGQRSGCSPASPAARRSPRSLLHRHAWCCGSGGAGCSWLALGQWEPRHYSAHVSTTHAPPEAHHSAPGRCCCYSEASRSSHEISSCPLGSAPSARRCDTSRPPSPRLYASLHKRSPAAFARSERSSRRPPGSPGAGAAPSAVVWCCQQA